MVGTSQVFLLLKWIVVLFYSILFYSAEYLLTVYVDISLAWSVGFSCSLERKVCPPPTCDSTGLIRIYYIVSDFHQHTSYWCVCLPLQTKLWLNKLLSSLMAAAMKCLFCSKSVCMCVCACVCICMCSCSICVLDCVLHVCAVWLCRTTGSSSSSQQTETDWDVRDDMLCESIWSVSDKRHQRAVGLF